MDRVTDTEIAELEERFAALNSLIGPIVAVICAVGFVGGVAAVLLGPASAGVSNVRPAPFSITPGRVGQVLGDVALRCRGNTEVPFAAVQLVDRPRRSEDPRLARANDDGRGA